ncbi:MAG: SUF system Fe-S cluster assembly protein [Rhodospirillales bacterium]
MMNSGIPSSDLPVMENGDAEGFRATAGEPLAAGTTVAGMDPVIEALQTVFDPEIPVNIYELGLIYNVDIADDGNVAIEMSLTAPGCPVAGEMPGEVARAVAAVDGIGKVDVQLVWDPAWTPERMSEDAKLALGIDH